MTTIDDDIIKNALQYFPRVVNYLRKGHPLQSLVYHDYCDRSSVKSMYESLLDEVIPTCCFTAMNLLRLKMDLLICTRICFENKEEDRCRPDTEDRLIKFLARDGLWEGQSFEDGIQDFLEAFFKTEKSKMKDPNEKIVLGLGNELEDRFIFEIREFLMELYKACDDKIQKDLIVENVPRSITGTHDPKQTDWVCGWNERNSRLHYDPEFVTHRPNMSQFVCVTAPQPLYCPGFDNLEAADIDDVEKLKVDLNDYLERGTEVVPARFYKTFCFTGISNESVFTESGLKSSRTEEYGIVENSRDLPHIDNIDLLMINGEQVDLLMTILEDLLVPLEKRNLSPDPNTPPDPPRKKRKRSPSPVPEKRQPKFYGPSATPAVIEDFRPTRRDPIMTQDDGWLNIPALLGTIAAALYVTYR